MSIDIYSPRVLAGVLKEAKPVRTFLRDTFFPKSVAYRTENVDIDSQVKGRRVAPFVNRWAPGRFVERIGFETTSVAPPCIAMKTTITAQDVSKRVMGEHAYEDRAPEARAQELLADDLAELLDMKARREEMMCRDAIFTLSGNNSRVTANGDDCSQTIDFARNAELQIGTLTSTAAWTHADSDPLAKIDEWCELYAKVTGKVVTDIVFGGTAYRTFLDNVKVKAKMVNTSLIQTGVIAENGVPDGARFVGALYGGALRMWTYHEWYDDPDNSGTTTEMVPLKKVMLCSRNLMTEMRYGALQTITSEGPDGVPTLVAVPVLPRSWVTVDPPTRYLEIRSRPLPVPVQNHFLTAQVQA
jgi:hypothetical protein